jgi:hypothetical protein
MKTSICIVTHHKPFLITASLISLALQKFNDYDLHIIFIKGNGNHKKYLQYNKLISKYKKNTKLSKSSNQILTILKNFKKKKKIHVFKNDQALDSGAWIKFISKKIWEKYNYNFFLMEGFIFKSDDALYNLQKFIIMKKPDAIMLGSEKLFTTKERLNKYALVDKVNKINIYHQEVIKKTFKDFCKFSGFKNIYSNWRDKKIFKRKNEKNLDIIFNFPHIRYFSFLTKFKLFIKFIFKEQKFYNPFSNLIFFNEGSFRYLLPRKFFFNKEIKIGNLTAHIEDSPFVYVNGCQHIFSKKILDKMNKMFLSINIRKILNYPFVGTPLEFIWGMLPNSLGFKKWHADCLHRPRKNFLTYEKEDTAFFMKKYLEMYSENKIKITLYKNTIKISKYLKQYKYIKEILGKKFFT